MIDGTRPYTERVHATHRIYTPASAGSCMSYETRSR